MDCLIGMQEIPDKSIDMILCDLPYGTTACKWGTIIPFEPLWEQYKRIIKENGAICLFGTEPFSSLLRTSNLKQYKYDWIWEKENGSNFATVKYQPFRVHELISVFGDFPISYTKKGLKNYIPQFESGEPYNIKRKSYEREQMRVGVHKETELQNEGTRYPRSILRFNTVRGGLHPTQKPVELCEYLICTYTNEGETVLDNCMGSGTTAIACINTNRNYIGFEKDTTYFNLANDRITKKQLIKLHK